METVIFKNIIEFEPKIFSNYNSVLYVEPHKLSENILLDDFRENNFEISLICSDINEYNYFWSLSLYMFMIHDKILEYKFDRAYDIIFWYNDFNIDNEDIFRKFVHNSFGRFKMMIIKSNYLLKVYDMFYNFGFTINDELLKDNTLLAIKKEEV